MAQTRNAADEVFDRTLARYQTKHPEAMGCLAKDRTAMPAFYDFPAEHWVHIRISNPIESTFATIRLRTRRGRHLTAVHQI